MRFLNGVDLAILAVGALGAGGVSPGAAQGDAVKAIFEKYDLLGILAADCSNPGDARSLYLVNRAIDADHVQMDQMVGATSRQFTAIIDKACESQPNEIALSSTINDQRYNLVVQVERTRMRQVELDGPTGEKQIAGGRFTKDGVETPWYSRCQQSVTIHSSPEAGGRCIEAFNGEIKAGARLQMWDCNDTPPQVFAFDALNGRLTIGDLCVDTDGGGGQPGVELPLAACNGGPSQVWKTEANENYVKLVGINGLCVDVSDYYRENRAALVLWHCHGGTNQSWQLYSALNLTWEETVDRDGHHIGQFNLAAADAKLCQMSCIENHQCTAWVYRKPEGRTDHNPHCWLLDKTDKVSRGDIMLISGTVRPESPQ